MCAAGSILFAISCSAGLFTYVAGHSILNRLLVAYPYAVGSVLYTWGAYCSVLASSATLSSCECSVGHASTQTSSAHISAQSCHAADHTAAYGGAGQASSKAQGAHARPASDSGKAAAEEALCSSSGSGIEQLQLIFPWQQRSRRGWPNFRAISGPSIEALLGERRLRRGRLSDYDWAVVDWAGESFNAQFPCQIAFLRISVCNLHAFALTSVQLGMRSSDGHMDWDNAVQHVLHHTGSALLATGAPATRHTSSSLEVGCGRPQCVGWLPVCERQLHLLGSCCQDVQPSPAPSRMLRN